MPDRDGTEEWSNIARFIAKDIDIGLNGKVGYSLINCPSYLRINSTGHVTMLSRAMKMLNLDTISCQGKSSLIMSRAGIRDPGSAGPRFGIFLVLVRPQFLKFISVLI